MATIKMNPVFEGMTRKVGDLVFFKRNGETFVRRRGEINDPRSEAQLQVRAAFSELVEIWHVLGEPVKACWDIYARDKRCSGYNAFIGANAAAQREGRPLELIPGGQTLQGFTAEPRKEGLVTCARGNAAQNSYATIFIQKVEDDGSCARLERRDWGQGSELTLSITDPGSYYIYAVITGSSYDEATGVISWTVAQAGVSLLPVTVDNSDAIN